MNLMFYGIRLVGVFDDMIFVAGLKDMFKVCLVVLIARTTDRWRNTSVTKLRTEFSDYWVALVGIHLMFVMSWFTTFAKICYCRMRLAF